ncbi:MAG: NYN domain-containing protein [Syntrophorhabdaceae bacterium]|nr:NYN domain-containing protein [Syntrophorhabdaceae bacterium]MDD5243933.1 NYN domain-containing protein [Syntrophorhabdaceae bacterium]
MRKRTYIYIDGFNLYHRCLKDTSCKWLDLKLLFCTLLDQDNNIEKIKYFTTKVSGKMDPDQPTRQDTYLRALRAYIPELEIYYGQFFNKKMKAFSTQDSSPQLVKVNVLRNGGKKTIVAELLPHQLINVTKPEEKGSDVNLAIHLLNDAWLDLYDYAIVVSNDSDLREAVKFVTQIKKKVIGIGSPVEFPSKQLIQYADFVKHIRPGILAACQLPNPIPGTTICKPALW